MACRLSGVFVLLLLTCPSYAQTVRLSGRVADAETGEPLEGANVYMQAGRGTVTDGDGAFSLLLDAGRVVVRTSFVGYETRIDTLHLAADTRYDVALIPHPVGLQPLEVVGRRETSTVDSPRMSTVRLTVEEVERLPSFLGEFDLLKTIQLLPGVQSGTEGSTGLYVRGGGPDQNLVLLDGVPVYNPSHVFGFLSVFNVRALEGADIVKGAFPARYGGRLSSVVDLETRRGRTDAYGVDGAVGILMSSLSAEGPLVDERASFLVSARRTYIDVLAAPFLEKRLQEGQSLTSYFYDANARLDYRISARSRVSLTLYGGQDVYGFTDETSRPGAASPTTEVNRAASNWSNAVAVLRWTNALSDRLTMSAALARSRYRFDIRQRLELSEGSDVPTTFVEAVDYGSGIADWSASLDLRMTPGGGHEVRTGAGVTRHAFNPGVSSLSVRATGQVNVDSTLTPGSFPFSGAEAYAYVEDELGIGRRFTVNVGLHAASLLVDGTAYGSIQPRMSGRYLLRPDWSVKASFGTMQQYLHLLTNTGLNLPTDLWVAATDRIRPQEAWQAAVGTERSLAGGRFTAGLEAYYKRMDGLLEYVPGASFVVPGEDWQDKVATGSGRSYGLELLLRKRMGPFTGWFGYTLSWSRRRFDALNDGAAFPYRYDRRHDVSVALAYRWTDRLDLGATWVYGTGQAITVAEARFVDARVLDPDRYVLPSRWAQLRTYGERGGYRMAPYHRLDLVLNWHFDRVLFGGGEGSTLSIGAYNVYNRLNPFYLFEGRRPDGSRVFKQASLFPILPFVSYRFRF